MLFNKEDYIFTEICVLLKDILHRSCCKNFRIRSC